MNCSINWAYGKFLLKNIIIIIFINCNSVVPRVVVILHVYRIRNWLLINLSREVYEKHVVATWNLGNHLNVCLWTQGKQEKPVSMWSVTGPSEY